MTDVHDPPVETGLQRLAETLSAAVGYLTAPATQVAARVAPRHVFASARIVLPGTDDHRRPAPRSHTLTAITGPGGDHR